MCVNKLAPTECNLKNICQVSSDSDILKTVFRKFETRSINTPGFEFPMIIDCYAKYLVLTEMLHTIAIARAHTHTHTHTLQRLFLSFSSSVGSTSPV